MAVAWLFPARSGLMGFCFSCWGPSSSACGGTPVGWFCPLPSGVWRLVVSPLVFLEGQWCGSVGGAGFAVVACVFFRNPPLFVLHFSGDACPSQSVVGSAVVKVFRFLIRKGAVRPVSSSPGYFCRSLVFPKASV